MHRDGLFCQRLSSRRTTTADGEDEKSLLLDAHDGKTRELLRHALIIAQSETKWLVVESFRANASI